MEQTQTPEEVQDQTQDQTQEQQPIFKEIEGMTQTQAIEVLIQAGNLAQSSGRLSVRDSVMFAKAVDLLKPGTV